MRARQDRISNEVARLGSVGAGRWRLRSAWWRRRRRRGTFRRLAGGGDRANGWWRILTCDGARVSFPVGANHADTTVTSIAKNEGAAPAAHAGARRRGVHILITPHGGAFAMLAEVAIPVEQRNLADNEQLLP